jgi:hypothetical protein
MRWAFDPWAQFQYRLRPKKGSFWDIVARIARYAFSSSSWSFIWASVLTIDRVHQPEYLSYIEQEASSESGDTYTPLGRLRDPISVVGDIARYWWVSVGGYRDRDWTVLRGRADTPGVQTAYSYLDFSATPGQQQITNLLRVVPEVTDGKRTVNGKQVTDITLGTSNAWTGRCSGCLYAKTTAAINNADGKLAPANPAASTT